MEIVILSAECNEDTEEGAEATFKIYREGAYPNRDKPIAVLQGFNKNGVVKAEWEPVDVRERGDRTKLRYFFTIEMWRVPATKSKLILIENPQVQSMKWEPEFIYHGDKAKLHITTFEVARYSPTVKIQFWQRGKILKEEPVVEHEVENLTLYMKWWEHGKPEPYRMIYEEETTIDKDEVEITFDSSHSTDDSPENTYEDDYEVEAVIVHNSVSIKQPKPYLLVGAGSGEE
jgi:hypothetical protein